MAERTLRSPDIVPVHLDVPPIDIIYNDIRRTRRSVHGVGGINITNAAADRERRVQCHGQTSPSFTDQIEDL
jgi:hypothetical protein